jgi:hypothetical protein
LCESILSVNNETPHVAKILGLKDFEIKDIQRDGQSALKKGMCT